MPDESSKVIGAPDGNWLVQPPAEGEWLIAVAIPREADVPQAVLDAVDGLFEALGASGQPVAADVDPLCVKNNCVKNESCTVRR